MKLFLAHCGFYDKNISGGFYESHTIYFVVAPNAKEAKNRTKAIPEYKNKKMHIDGIKEINVVGDYKVILQKEIKSNENNSKEYSYDAVKKM